MLKNRQGRTSLTRRIAVLPSWMWIMRPTRGGEAFHLPFSEFWAPKKIHTSSSSLISHQFWTWFSLKCAPKSTLEQDAAQWSTFHQWKLPTYPVTRSEEEAIVIEIRNIHCCFESISQSLSCSCKMPHWSDATLADEQASLLAARVRSIGSSDIPLQVCRYR